MKVSVNKGILSLVSIASMGLAGQAQAWYDASRFDGTYTVECNNYYGDDNENAVPTVTDSYIELTNFRLHSTQFTGPNGEPTTADLANDPDFPTRLYLECTQDNELTINSGSRNIIENFVYDKCVEYNEMFVAAIDSIPGVTLYTTDNSHTVCTNATDAFMENIDTAVVQVTANNIWRPVQTFDVIWDPEDVNYFFWVRYSSPFTAGSHVNYGGGTMWDDRRPLNMALLDGPTQAKSIAVSQQHFGIPSCAGSINTRDTRDYRQISNNESVSSPDFNKINLTGNATKHWAFNCVNQGTEINLGFKLNHGYHGQNY